MTRELRTGWKSSPGQHLKSDWGIRPVSSSPVGIREGSPCAFECGAVHSKRKQWMIHSLMWLLGSFRNEAMVEIIDDPQVELMIFRFDLFQARGKLEPRELST